MLYLSFAGLLVGLLVFILLCFKKVNTILAAVVSVSIMLLASLPLLRESGLGFYQMLITGAKEQGFSSYMDGVGGFLKNYLLLFMLSALYGKVMEDSGAVRRLTLSLTKLIKKRKNVKFYATCLLPLFYTILGYCGISGFVMVFAVVALGRELFSECNVPWRFYCYGAVGNMTNGIIAGNLQAQNLKATALFGVSASAGAAMSLVFAAVQLAAAALMIYFDVRRSERRGEGFLPDGAAILKAQLKDPIPDEKLPSTFCAALPLLVTVGLILFLKLSAEATLLCAIVLCFVLFHRQMEKPMETLGTGLQAGVAPVVTVAAVAGLATIIPEMPGFTLITNAIDHLPNVYGGVLLIAVITALVANPVPVFSSEGITSILMDKFSSLSAGNAARLSLCSQAIPCPPWNAGAINAVALTKLEFKTAAWYYFKATTFPGLVALAVVLGLVQLGVFV